ncbi:hypothetical protein [Mycobacterium florentinum]|uniref:hypothetical protein n=1 Tax=Mycobacterium florentinum TaxID=292462 RepID=UPI00138C744B|nr:hypothetical protein [Mycobacterium florentinum]BBX80761.1 hypothetical protein MFLOJ_45480 [Mycobacterium florentinum]
MTTPNLAAAEEADIDSPSSETDDEPTGDAATEEDASAADTPVGDGTTDPAASAGRGGRWVRLLVFLVLPALTMLAGAGAAWLKYDEATARATDDTRAASVGIAGDATVAMLTYTADTAESKLTAAANLLTGPFRQSYENFVKTVVIPGAKQKQISATATVAAAASVSATETSAVVLVFVDQVIVAGKDAPTNTASAVEVTLTKVGGKWLVSGFEPR